MNRRTLYAMELTADILSHLSTVEDDTIWYIDDEAGVRMPLDDYIASLRREVKRQRQGVNHEAGSDEQSGVVN